jgi:hypothetical protein
MEGSWAFFYAARHDRQTGLRAKLREAFSPPGTGRIFRENARNGKKNLPRIGARTGGKDEPVTDLKAVTHRDFAGCLDQEFRLHADGAQLIDLRLASVDLRGPEPASGRRPFSLIFAGPAEPLLPQRMYRIEHDVLGRLDLFLVPIGPDGDAMRYEAVFA